MNKTKQQKMYFLEARDIVFKKFMVEVHEYELLKQNLFFMALDLQKVGLAKFGLDFCELLLDEATWHNFMFNWNMHNVAIANEVGNLSIVFDFEKYKIIKENWVREQLDIVKN